MEKQLQIAKGISLPLDVVTQTIAILAKRRAGKSYTMRRIAEQLLDNDQQIILVDPKGDQWGIRSSADGKKPGYPVVIFGGEHGDVPLEVGAGELIAKLVVEERVSILLDLSEFRKHEIATFMTSFLENLYRLKAKEAYRTPCTLIIDEADAIAPQKPQSNEARMLGAAEDIVRRGGQRGIGCFLITQRSAVLNKNVLTQAQMLIVLRTIAPQDLSAMKAWIEVHGDLEQGKMLMDSLPSLPVGDAWFWSPGWPTAEGIFERAHVLPITTFDSGATPKPGERKVLPKNLADIDLDVLKKQMSATIEKAKADDPKELKKEIARLTKELGAKPIEFKVKSTYAPEDKAMTQIVVDRAVSDALAKRDREWKEKVTEGNKEIDRLSKVIMQISRLTSGDVNTGVVPMKIELPQTKKYLAPMAIIAVPKPLEKVANEIVGNNQEVNLKAGARKMIGILVAKHPMKLGRTQLATLANIKSKGSTFSTYLSALRASGLIDDSDGFINPTEKAMELYGDAQMQPQSATEIRTMWRSKLKEGARRMFDLLEEAYPQKLTREELAERTGIAADGSTFSTYLSTMRANGLIVDVGRDVVMHDDLFIE